MRASRVLLLAVVAWLTSGGVRADVQSYAIVVGSNRGGPGQAPLRYAQQDARRFAELLVELGRMPAGHVRLVFEPTPLQIEQEIAVLRQRLAQHAAKGESSRLVFYYSGHARSRGLSLGRSELPLEELRRALIGLPSTLTVVVLDACQSGAFSGVKGAAPAADFSTSSVFDLRNEGVAVMASSTGAELSQESEELSSSYFTHHLVTGLRGAADLDGDGTVSLDEAYRYAYQNTLSDTLRTRVGSQHATLETELKGHGDVPLTYTSDADAVLQLPESLEGRIVVQRRRRGAVLAELTKARGSALSLALPHGDYEVLVRRGIASDVLGCEVTLEQHVTLTLSTLFCPVVKLPGHTPKGMTPYERWFVEAGTSFRFARDDAYVDTLKDFRFQDQGSPNGLDLGSFAPQLAGGAAFNRHAELLARLDRLAARELYRSLERGPFPNDETRFKWRSWSIALAARGRWPLLDERLAPFAELGVGLGIARSTYEFEGESNKEAQYGPVLLAAVGTSVHLFWRFGLVLKVAYDYAPILRNELGQRHDDGGLNIGLALRLRGLRGAF
ncbi:MAG TPA: caspase family protein [Polyangiales bacterium]